MRDEDLLAAGSSGDDVIALKLNPAIACKYPRVAVDNQHCRNFNERSYQTHAGIKPDRSRIHAAVDDVIGAEIDLRHLQNYVLNPPQPCECFAINCLELCAHSKPL